MFAARLMELTQIVEALLFASQEPLSTADISRAVKETVKDMREDESVPEWLPELEKTTDDQVAAAIAALVTHYDEDGRAFTVVERSSGWRLCARPDFAEWARSLYPGKKQQRLSQPALETLAIIAYRQPITRAGVEAVRGVSVDAMVQQLLDRGLIKIEGRAELPGRPLLYGTTDAFLDHFGVRTLDDLPNSAELRRMKLPTAEPDAAAAESPAAQQLTLDVATGTSSSGSSPAGES
jgi:segregation and condensation protein B